MSYDSSINSVHVTKKSNILIGNVYIEWQSAGDKYITIESSFVLKTIRFENIKFLKKYFEEMKTRTARGTSGEQAAVC